MEDRRATRQLRAGRDFGRGDFVAKSMANFSYVVGDRDSEECLLVDPAWDPLGIAAIAESEGCRIAGILVTHAHPDHVGGPMMGLRVRGVSQLLEGRDLPVYVHPEEAGFLVQQCGVPRERLVPCGDGDVVRVGRTEIACIHTPGHSPGSLCFRMNGAILTGDTLFVEGCGRMDLPGGNADEMWRSLYERLADVDDDVIVYPGHDYGGRPDAPFGELRRFNPYLRFPNLEAWRRVVVR